MLATRPMYAKVAQSSPPIAISSPPSDRNRPVISHAASFLLDVVRFSAALAVVVEHVCLDDFSTGARDRQLWGYIAVPVFFVLSGFIIRFVTSTRENTLREYAIDRASRIYSVVLPTLVINAAIGGFCWLFNRHRFLEIWLTTFQHAWVRVLLNLTFFSQAWGMDAAPFLDRPFWSLGYECIYYALFGIAFFLRGWKRIALLALLCLGIGPNVLLLLPVWVLGCFTFDAYIRLRKTSARLWIPLCALALLIVLGAATLAGYTSPSRLFTDTVLWMTRLPNPVDRLGISVKHASMLNLGMGVLASPVLLVLLLAAEDLPIRLEHGWVQTVRRIAEGTFAVYLLHYPLLVLAYFLGGLGFKTWVRNTLTVTLICTFLVLLSPAFDKLKRSLRSRLRQLFPTPGEKEPR